MNNDKNKMDIDYGGNTFTTLQLIFLTLKLAGLVDWSWWFVFTPFFASVTIAVIVVLAVFLITRKNKIK